MTPEEYDAWMDSLTPKQRNQQLQPYQHTTSRSPPNSRQGFWVTLGRIFVWMFTWPFYLLAKVIETCIKKISESKRNPLASPKELL